MDVDGLPTQYPDYYIKLLIGVELFTMYMSLHSSLNSGGAVIPIPAQSVANVL